MKSRILGRQCLSVALAFLALSLAGVSNTAVAETPVVNEIQKVLASDKGDSDYFGHSVALDGDTAVIGAWTSDDSGTTSTGAAHVFNRVGGIWTEQAKLLASDKAVGDFFGYSVALEGDTAVIGALYEDDSGTDGNGAVYVFTRAGGIWTEQAKLLASDKADGDFFGRSVALDGDTAIIGASSSDDSGEYDNGAAYVFTRVGGIWTEQAKLLASDKADNDIFGWSVALDGDTAVIAALYSDDSGTRNNGAAYVFTRVGGIWTEQAKLLASDKAGYHQFGYSIALDGDTALIGARGSDDSGTDNNGAAYVFTRVDGIWTEQAKLLASDKANEDDFGSAVALDGDTTVIGARWSSDSGTYANGAAYVFTRVGGIWTEQAKLLASEKAGGDVFGRSVALDGDTTVIGAPYSDDSGTTNNGAAYVFDVSWLIPSIDIAIDVRPGNLGNDINPRSRGRFWVAVLSDSEFDALQVDPATVALGPGEASPDRYRVKDVNRDRLPDLMLRFRTPEVGLHCGDTEVELTGETYAGDSVIGTDKVKTVGCKKPKKGKKK